MAIGTPTTIGQNAFFSASTTVVLSGLSGLPQPGAKLIVFAGCETAGTTASAIDSQLNTYTVDVTANATQNASFFVLSTDQDLQGLVNSDSITVTFSGSRSDRLIAGCYVTGLGGLDKTQTGNGNTLSPDSGATATTTQADELVIGGSLNNCAVYTSSAPGSGLTEIHDFSNTDQVGLTSLFKIVAAPGAYNVNSTITGSSDVWNAAVATYKGAAAGGGVITPVGDSQLLWGDLGPSATAGPYAFTELFNPDTSVAPTFPVPVIISPRTTYF